MGRTDLMGDPYMVHLGPIWVEMPTKMTKMFFLAFTAKAFLTFSPIAKVKVDMRYFLPFLFVVEMEMTILESRHFLLFPSQI
jgi:hypothetical protein